MTAVAERPGVERPATEPPATEPPAAGPAAEPSAPHLPVAELALVGVTTAAVLSLSRLFQDWSFFWPLLAVVAYSHLATLLLRRRGVGVAMSAVVATIGFVLLASWLWFASSTFYGVPEPGTWSALTGALHDSWSAFQELTAPVPVQAGFVVAAALAVYFAVFLADWAAFRLWSPIESIIPALTLFLFSTLLGSEQQRMTSAFAFCAATLVYLLAHRVARLETSSGWLTADIRRGSSWLLRAGITLAAVAVIGGAIIGPRLPTANDDAIIEFRQGENGGPSSRVTVSPLVNIRGRIVDQSNVTVFTVRSSQKAYWRLTALDSFDGQIWRSSSDYGDADGDLGADQPSGIASEQVDQDYVIEALSAIWLPAAYQPVRLDAPDLSARYNSKSSTLIVDTSYQNSDTATYHVVSAVPTPTREALEAADQSPTGAVAEEMQQPELSPAARRVADDVQTAAAADPERYGDSPYGRALALQDYFRDDGPFADDGVDFTYSLDVDANDAHHDLAAIDAFLASRTGYCEMFAGTYAAIARLLDLPSRVAVGFTWGDAGPGEGEYTVKGKNAHAWPEVWLGEDVGWIAFEPTPTRGAPGMAAYAGTDVVEAQDEDAAAGTDTTSTTATTTPSPSSTTPDAANPDDLSALLGTSDTSSANANGDGAPVLAKLALVALVLLAAVAIYVAGASVYTALRRRRRRERAVEPDEQVALAWTESLEDLEMVGVVRAGDETHAEFAHRAGSTVPATRAAIGDLAGLADVAAFAPGAVDRAEAYRARDAAASIAEVVHARVPAREAWVRRIDPRRLLRSGRAATRQQARSSRG